MEIETDKRLVVDLDGVLVQKHPGKEYADLQPDTDVLDRLHEYEADDFYIILYTARNMRTYEGRIGKITADTAPTIHQWLEEHDVPYDELHLGKPWCGHDGYYVDDRAVRPSEFLEKDHEEILDMIDREVRRESTSSRE